MASKPRISPIEVFPPFLTGGVLGRKKLNIPNTIDAMEAVLKVRIRFPDCSQFNHPMSRPAIIHPIVPKTLIDGNSFPGSLSCLNEIELTILDSK